MSSQTVLLEKLLDTTVQDIIPLTRKGVEKGCKVFGAAILLKKDLSLVIAETNNEIVSPLLVSTRICPASYISDTKDFVAWRDQLYTGVLEVGPKYQTSTERLYLLRNARTLLPL